MDIEQNRSYDPEYFNPLAMSEERHFWFKSRNRLISSFLSELKKKIANQSLVLEIGCGTGNVLRAINEVFPDRHVLGMDLYHDGLVYAKDRVNCSLVQGDLHTPPFSTQFGIIGLFDVLEHIQDDVLVLTDLNRMIEPNGHLILTVPAFTSLWSYFDIAGHHVRRYSQEELNLKLAEAGFNVTHSSYFMSLLFPLVWMRRKLAGKRTLTKSKDDNALYNTTIEELNIIPVLNEVLEWILRIENWLICRGFRFPFGTSLITLAEKKPLNSNLA